MPDAPFILGGKNAAINVVHQKGRYAVQLGSTDGKTFQGNILHKPMDSIPNGMTPEKIAEIELEVLKENPCITAFVNGVLYRKHS